MAENTTVGPAGGNKAFNGVRELTNINGSDISPSENGDASPEAAADGIVDGNVGLPGPTPLKPTNEAFGS